MPRKETVVMSAIRHNERCRDCKEAIKNLLATIFHDVEVNYDINLPAKLEDYSDTNIYDDIAPVYQPLQNHRGYQ